MREINAVRRLIARDDLRGIMVGGSMRVTRSGFDRIAGGQPR